MGKNASPALAALIENVNAAKKAGVFASTLALAREAKKDEKTVRRVLNGENEPALDTVSALAKALGVEPWVLIQPQAASASTPSLASALVVVLDAMARTQARAELRQLLPMLVDTNAVAYRSRLLELLQESQASDLQDRPPEILASHQAEIDARVKAAEEQNEQQKHSSPTAKKRSS